MGLRSKPISKESIERLLSVLQLIATDTEKNGNIRKGVSTILKELEIANPSWVTKVLIKEKFVYSSGPGSNPATKWIGPIPPNIDMAKRILEEVRKQMRHDKLRGRNRKAQSQKPAVTTKMTDKVTPAVEAIQDQQHPIVRELIAEKAKLNKEKLTLTAEIDKKIDAINTLLGIYRKQ